MHVLRSRTVAVFPDGALAAQSPAAAFYARSPGVLPGAPPELRSLRVRVGLGAAVGAATTNAAASCRTSYRRTAPTRTASSVCGRAAFAGERSGTCMVASSRSASRSPTGTIASGLLWTQARSSGRLPLRFTLKASCQADAGAIGYLFQYGTDSSHPESWAPPAQMRGHTFTLRNLPVGQLLCVRIAVLRRGSVQGAWSIVLQATVR